ncbi:hypothetical protein M407DRAFT_22759 [Tulasnella calospora MUT 4182]|uniref:Uncharacterized protein n=1 Tax=Tulasnella calospora MUT 4182 TaxID=1051891 RepID=A0A0C3QKP9_9AGAM|nr:hypothetical protein M407DRAFT_22759 [Tulasnella calospora MUT 4182]
MAKGEVRKMAMKRNPNGPVDVWCWAQPDSTAVREFIEDAQTIHETRWRSILYDYRSETEGFLNHLRTQTSSLIDVFLFNPNVSYGSTVSLDLSPEGPHLRHVDIRGMGLPWQSPRLTNLATLSLRYIYHRIPQPEHLYTILSSSPRLERLCVTDVTPGEIDPTGSLPTTSPPITLPVLATLVFKNVSNSITHSIVPLIRAPACKTVVVDGEGELSFRLRPQETTFELLAQPITASESLKLKFKMGGESCLHIQSEPYIAPEWVYWAHDKPGVDVRLAVHSADGLARMWSQLDVVLGSRGAVTNIKTLEIECSADVLGQELPFPSGLFGFCPELATLRCVDDTGTAFRRLLRLLQKREGAKEGTALRRLVRLLPKREGTKEGVRIGTSKWPIPKLNHLIYSVNTMLDEEKCAAALKAFLELRYPSHSNDSTLQSIENPTPLKTLDLPSALAVKLKAMDISTFLKLDDVIQSPDLDD